jgi:xanthine dehydrogenase accessory factor
MKVWSTIAKAIEAHDTCALVSLVEVEGSAPREPGARMIVTLEGFRGTIGGGALEWRAIAEAQAGLGKGRSVTLKSQALGPELGQCCGGRVRLLTEVFDRTQLDEAKALALREERGAFTTEGSILADRVERRIASDLSPPRSARASRAPEAGQDARIPRGGKGAAPNQLIEHFGDDRRPLHLFGAGHVGRALVLALAPLPFTVRWIDSRPDAFPAAVPPNVETLFSPSPPAELAKAPENAFILVMTHSHPLDLAIVEQAMREARFVYIGLIGSSTKRARFASRLRAGGIPEACIAELVCPIGIGGITGKAPAIIAAATAAELLKRDELLRSQQNPLAVVPEPSKMAAGRA